MPQETLHNPVITTRNEGAGSSVLPPVDTTSAALTASANARHSAEQPSEWLQQMRGELQAFEDSGYQDLGTLHIENPNDAPDAAAPMPAPVENHVQPNPNRRLLSRYVGKHALTGEQPPRRLSEQERDLNGQLILPEDAKVNEDLSTEETVVRTFRLGSAEVMVASPRSGVLMEDSDTGKPLDPMLLVLGINGDPKYPWATMAFSQGGEELPQDGQPHAGRHVIGIRYPEKLEGKIQERVPLGQDNDTTVPKFDMIPARNILTALQTLQANRVDVVTESRGAILNTIAMELARQEGTLSVFGDVLNISPAGLGGESSPYIHAGASAIAIHGIYRSLLLREKLDPIARRLKGSGNIPGGRFFRDPLGWRREQVSVAGAADMDLPAVIARVNDDPERRERRDTITHTYDPLDPAIREKNLAKQNVGDIPLKRTKFFGHAIPYGRKSAVRTINMHFQEVHNDRSHHTLAG